MKRPLDSRRFGALLVCVLICLGIAISIMLTSLSSSLRTRRQTIRELQMEQTRWLTDAGIARALDKIRVDERYSGESWTVTPALSDHQEATIEVSIPAEKSQSGKRQISVTATISSRDQRSQPTRRTRTIAVD